MLGNKCRRIFDDPSAGSFWQAFWGPGLVVGDILLVGFTPVTEEDLVRYQAGECDQFTPGPYMRSGVDRRCAGVFGWLNFSIWLPLLSLYGLWQMAQPVRGLVWAGSLPHRLQPVPFGAWGLLCNRHPRQRLIVRIIERARPINFW